LPGGGDFFLKVGLPGVVFAWGLFVALFVFPVAVGFYFHLGSTATTYGGVMGVVASVLPFWFIFFLDSGTSSKTVGVAPMRSVGVLTARRHIFLDYDLDIDDISPQLDVLVALAPPEGMAIGIGHVLAYPIGVLVGGIPILLEQGFEF
jgi:Uncharacterized protein conserved in bacteria